MNADDNKLAFWESRHCNEASEPNNRHQVENQYSRNVGDGEPGDRDHGPLSPGARPQDSEVGRVNQLNKNTVLYKVTQ